MAVLEFWYEFASTYSYPAAMRVTKLAECAGVSLRWRPFLLGVASGLADSPFNTYPIKGRYMWRDLARLCAEEELPLLLPPVRFPQNSLKAARLALVGEAEGWMRPFSCAVYTANFAEQRDISDEATLAEILKKLGVDSARAIAAANAPENKERLKAQNEEAKTRDIFGAPFFAVGDEQFWGNDRLEQAIKFAASHPR